MPRPALLGPTIRFVGTLAAALSLGGCLLWLKDATDTSPSDGPSEPPSLEWRARAMLEQAVYIPISEDRDDWVLRRCSKNGEQVRCELVFVHAGAITRTLPAYHPSQRYTRAEHDLRTEQLAEQLDDLDLDDEYLTVRQRDVKSMVRLSAAYGAPSYLVTLRDGLLEIGYEATREQDWVQPLAAVRFEGEVRIDRAFSSFQERRLVAFQMRHQTATGSTESWVVFRRSETKMAGAAFVVPSPEGLVGKVVPVAQKRRLKQQSKPTPAPRPVPTPPSPVASAPPASSAPVVIATRDAGTGGAAWAAGRDQPCQSQKDCADIWMCLAPEEASWNGCGAPSQPQCPEGFTGDRCGHCYQVCRSDADCRDGRRCNGEGGHGYCISPRRCMSPPPKRP